MRAAFPARREKKRVNQPKQPVFNLWLSLNLKIKGLKLLCYSDEFNMLNIRLVWKANGKEQEEDDKHRLVFYSLIAKAPG